MKALVLLMAAFPFVCRAQWSDEDKALGIAALSATALDLAQTRWLVKECPKRPSSCHEENPLLGKHPSIGRVDAHFTAALLGTYLIADALPADQRTLFLYSIAGVELVVVGRNKYLGYGMRF